MALETLEGLKEINGVKILVLEESKKLHSLSKPDGSFDWDLFDEYRKDFPISIANDINTISFKIQDGPIKENGLNGCQVVDMIAVARHIITELNKKFPCRENAMTITKLDEALMWQEARTANRTKRNVEGRNEK